MPDTLVVIIIIVIIILCLLSAIFSASETAFSSLNIIRIKQIGRSVKKRKQSQRVIKIIDRYDQFIATILILNNIVNITMSSLATYLFSILLKMGSSGVLVGTIIISILLITFGEIIPKNIGKAKAEKLALLTSRAIAIFMVVFSPLTRFFAQVNRRLLETMDDEVKLTATEDELIQIVETIEKEGVLEQDESELIQSAIVFDSKTVQTVMRRKKSVTVFDSQQRVSDILDIVTDKNFSRYPLIDKESGSIEGVIQEKDLFKALAEKNDPLLCDIKKEPVYISYRRLLPYALSKLQRERTHIAIVVDNLEDLNYLGIVTLEDILEELVGEIYDEYDELPKGIVTYGHHTYVIDGSVSVDYLFDILDEAKNPYSDKNVDLWVRGLFKFKGVKANATVNYDNLKIKILETYKGRKVSDRSNQYIKTIEVNEITKF